MIKFRRDGFGYLEMIITIKGKHHIFKKFQYVGFYTE